MNRFFVLLLVISVVACTKNSRKEKIVGLVADSAMVVCAHPLAAKIGVDILKKGGNAIDAAVAVQFALCVVFPAAGNIGGGGFLVVREKDGKVLTLDYREKAPAKATTDMFLDKEGEVVKGLSTEAVAEATSENFSTLFSRVESLKAADSGGNIT